MSERKTKNKQTKGRKPLPRSGLAEDVLGTVQAEDQTATPADPEVNAAVAEAAPAAPAGPERIFEFADQLNEEGADGGPEKLEEIIEIWVTFGLVGEIFALPVTHVQEILRVDSITAVPHAPNPVRGVTNKRGRVLPVVDLCLRLGLPAAETTASSRILVVESRGRLLGLLVDSVDKVARIKLSGVQAPPPDVMTAQSDYIRGVYNMDESLVIMLDVDRVLVIQESAQAFAG